MRGLTFDLYADLVLVPPGHVADDTQVGTLVQHLDVPDLQRAVTVGPKSVSLKVPLPVLGPAGNKNTQAAFFFFSAAAYSPASSHHLSSGTGEPKNRQSKKARLPSITFR